MYCYMLSHHHDLNMEKITNWDYDFFSETQQHDLLFLEENRNLLIFINKAKILPNNLLVIVALASFKLTELKR